MISKGFKHSEETKLKMRMSHAKRPIRKQTEETKRRISETRILRKIKLSPQSIAKIQENRKWYKPTPDILKKMSIALSGKNNPMYGKKWSEKTRIKNSGENHKFWKGNEVSYEGLHSYIKKYLPKSLLCQNCGLSNKLLDCANISGEYKRELNDWEWLCRKCHMLKDGRLALLKYGKRLISNPNNRIRSKRNTKSNLGDDI